MRNNYGKDYNKGTYQATGTNKENRSPNAPTQGGYTKTGDTNKGGFDKSKQQSQKPNQTQNNWGTGSINKDKDNRDRNK